MLSRNRKKRSNVKTTQTKVDPRASLSPSESPGWESLWGLSRTGPCSSRWKRGREQEEEEEEEQGRLVMKKDTKVFRDLDDWRPEGSNKRMTPYMGEFSTSLCCLYDMLLKMWKIILVLLRECKMSYVYTVSFFLLLVNNIQQYVNICTNTFLLIMLVRKCNNSF